MDIYFSIKKCCIQGLASINLISRYSWIPSQIAFISAFTQLWFERTTKMKKFHPKGPESITNFNRKVG
jgi:hypothetical protein